MVFDKKELLENAKSKPHDTAFSYNKQQQEEHRYIHSSFKIRADIHKAIKRYLIDNNEGYKTNWQVTETALLDFLKSKGIDIE